MPVKLPGCQALRGQHACCAAFTVSAPCSKRSPLGTHRKPSRIQKLLPVAAVPALAGMAASVCLAPQALADQAPAKAAAHSATADAAVLHVGMTPAQLLSTMQHAAGRAPAKAQAARYNVKAGDSRSA